MRTRQLLAHLSADEALVLVRQRLGPPPDEGALRAWWDAAQIRKATRPDTWSTPIERDVPVGCEDYVTEVKAIPQAAAIGLRPWAFKIVDLRRVVGFQIGVHEPRIRVPDGLAADPCSLLRFTISKPQKRTLAVAEGPGENELTIAAASVNLRVVGQLKADVPMGPAFGFVIGGGLPWLQVVAFNGRHVLRDGYHRAVGLLRAGIFDVPVARIEGEQLADLGIRPGFFAPDLVLGSQPPLLTDFLDDGLSQEGEVRSEIKVIRITAQQFSVPVIGEEGLDPA
jgi:hypothetical protein